jgi:hypothetical protein
VASLVYRCFLVLLGRKLACTPYNLTKLTRAVEEREGAFHTRDVLAGPISLEGSDFKRLHSVERSRDKCAPVYFLLEKKVQGVWTEKWKGVFSLTQCTFNVDDCSLEVTIPADDGYSSLYNNWDKKINILGCPAPRTTLITTIDTLNLGSLDQFEFKRIDSLQEGDFSGNGWSVFLRNTSWITGSLLTPGTRSRDVIIFRLARRGVPYELNEETGDFEPPDLSDQGFELDDEWVPTDGTTRTADYVRAISITGFKTYKIGTYDDWLGRKYGKDLILTSPDAPAPGAGYIKVTGPDPIGANNAPECPTALNLRRKLNDKNCKALWWRYGSFRFTRCFPFLEGLNYVLKQTVPSLAPDDAANLSEFFTQDRNQSTGETGRQNEVNRLYLAAGSDIKRPASSEPATRLMISAKDLFTDTANNWDAGWFIDPATGKLRFEHRAYIEASGVQELDLTNPSLRPNSLLKYSYLLEKMPRTERLQVQNGSSEGTNFSFLEGVVTYAGACVNQEEGQNDVIRSVGRLTGDIRALVLDADRLPDDCLAVLVAAPLSLGQLTPEVENGNQALAASNLFKRYHRRGRVLPEGVLDFGGPVLFDSTRPTVKLDPLTVECVGLDPFTLQTPYQTRYSKGGKFQQAELSLEDDVVTATILHDAIQGEGSAPGFEREFDGAQFNSTQWA